MLSVQAIQNDMHVASSYQLLLHVPAENYQFICILSCPYTYTDHDKYREGDRHRSDNAKDRDYRSDRYRDREGRVRERERGRRRSRSSSRDRMKERRGRGEIVSYMACTVEPRTNWDHPRCPL